MGAEGSRIYSPGYDEDNDFYGGYIQGPPIIREGSSTREPATSTIVDIYNTLGSDMDAISKLTVHVSFIYIYSVTVFNIIMYTVC